jgi:hypothetical protein
MTQKLIHTARRAKNVKSWVLVLFVLVLFLLSTFGSVGTYQTKLETKVNNIFHTLDVAKSSCFYSEDFDSVKNKICLENLAIVSHQLDTSLSDNSYFAYKWQVLLEYQNLKQTSIYIKKEDQKALLDKSVDRLKIFYPMKAGTQINVKDLSDFDRLYYIQYEKDTDTKATLSFDD